MLPTDKRYLRLTERQKLLLFHGYVQRAPDEAIRESIARENTPLLGEGDKVNFVKVLGYTPEQVRRMEENLRRAGLMGDA